MPHFVKQFLKLSTVGTRSSVPSERSRRREHMYKGHNENPIYYDKKDLVISNVKMFDGQTYRKIDRGIE